MLDIGIVTQFIQSKIYLQNKLAEVGIVPGSSEIESEMMLVETRMTASIKQNIHHGIEEMNALRFILNEIYKKHD